MRSCAARFWYRWLSYHASNHPFNFPTHPKQNMLKSMDPDSLAAAMQQSGMNVTPEQARAMADKLDSVSGGRGGVAAWEQG